MGKQIKRKPLRRKNAANKIKQRKMVDANCAVIKKLKALCSKSIQ